MKSLALWMLAACMAASASAREPPSVSDQPPALVQQRILDLVNRARARGRSCGAERFAAAPPLQVSDALFRAARTHARDMARHGYFEHESRNGRTPKDRVQKEGYRLRFTGENIAFGPETAEEVVQGWLGSPGHCANMMDPRFSDMGAAVAKGRQRGHYYWVQEFGQPAR
jgi:uncharacterized protein YkwD